MPAKTPPWSPEKYRLFEAERTRPVNDLLAATPTPAAIRRATDLGCGPGNSTEILAQTCPNASITGIDTSPDMLQAARARLPSIRFEQADIANWTPPEKQHLILANASLQWVPHHETLLPRLLGHLAPGGTLAIQMPDNENEPTHRLMREIAAESPWAAKLAAASESRTSINPPEWYHDLLQAHRAHPKIWRTTYYQPLAGGLPAIIDWFASTGLRPYLAPLDPAGQTAYLARYQAELANHYHPLPTGEILLPFPRLFILATKPPTPGD